MRKELILALALAGCGSGGVGNRASHADSPPAAPVQTRSLTGLYQSGDRARPSQLCILEQGGGARFGLVTWQSGRPGCSGAGAAARHGGRLNLAMAGEESCVIEARIEGEVVTFPAVAPPGCHYYCAPAAPLTGIVFTKTGGAAADALGARDLVGDSLCG